MTSWLHPVLPCADRYSWAGSMGWIAINMYGVCAYRSVRGRRRILVPTPCRVCLFAFCFFWYEGTETWSLGSWESGTRSMEVLVYGVLRKKGGRLVVLVPLSLSIGHQASPMSCQSSYLSGWSPENVLRTSSATGALPVTSGTGVLGGLFLRTGQSWTLVPSGRTPRPPETPSNPRPKNTRLTCLAGNSAPSSETVAGLFFRRHRVL
ncbi:uncharacterized protein BDZ83DRAFT_193395 [Colletotrichum acutatum]|uniref:Uncharacterized protein n=1 Tax=Glomerella acutata TaxID=27357 RepID=A0AAD8XAT6_GLOAC|nr:uncharacterized protein BDZ83DRAFT_193395 [Colletotrichum acutatum]KAK1706140.1 hypothetical protein BDZ83DRAFT_193395 [Colletotrichum acutatum]